MLYQFRFNQSEIRNLHSAIEKPATRTSQPATRNPQPATRTRTAFLPPAILPVAAVQHMHDFD